MATRTIANGGGNWNALGTWVEGAVPLATDNVVATATSGQVTVNVSTAVCASIILTGYTNTLTFTSGQTLTVSGTVTFVVGMALSGTGTLRINSAATITSAGITFPGNLQFIAAATYVLGDNWTVTGLVTTSTGAVVLNSNTLICNGGLNHTVATSGTTNIKFGGPGTWSGGGALSNNVNIQNTGTLTVSNVRYGGSGTLTYTSGTVNATGTLTLTNTPTLNVSGITWNNISGLNAALPTVALTSNLTCTGTMALGTGNSGTMTFTGAFNVSCGTLEFPRENILVFPASQTLTVTSTISMANTQTGVLELKSGTPSTSMFLNFTGNLSGNKIFMANFTDVDASGSSQPILNYFGGNPGGTLTRTANIRNVNLPITPAFTWVA